MYLLFSRSVKEASPSPAPLLIFLLKVICEDDMRYYGLSLKDGEECMPEA